MRKQSRGRKALLSRRTHAKVARALLYTALGHLIQQLFYGARAELDARVREQSELKAMPTLLSVCVLQSEFVCAWTDENLEELMYCELLVSPLLGPSHVLRPCFLFLRGAPRRRRRRVGGERSDRDTAWQAVCGQQRSRCELCAHVVLPARRAAPRLALLVSAGTAAAAARVACGRFVGGGGGGCW